MIVKRTLKRRGFTLIELLVVVLILSILMAVALPLYLSAVADAQKKTCRANLQTIANAVMAARVKNNASDYSSIISAGVTTVNLPDLQAVPKCPSNGLYSLTAGSGVAGTSFKVQCGVTAGTSTLHGTFEPGVDSQ